MKKILILGLLMVSHLWGLKEWNGSICTSLNCRDEEQDLVPKIPDDYQPQKGDRVIKVKVGNVEGEILCINEKDGKQCFIKGNQEKSYRYVGFLFLNGEIFFIDYPNYKVAFSMGVGRRGNIVSFFQIFAIENRLEMFEIIDGSPIEFCIYNKDSPCPLTKDYLLDWIKKQGGQEFFDNACPLYFENQETDSICKEGIIRDRKCEELPCNPFAGCTPCDNETEE